MPRSGCSSWGRARFRRFEALYRTNLPVPATPFLGREEELAVVAGMLDEPDVRLVSLVGPGGTGKTRLALQAAAEASDSYPDGVFWAPLAPLRDPALVLPAVATALSVGEGKDSSPAHAAAVDADRAVDKIFQLGESHDIGKLSVDLGPRHSGDHTNDVDILAPRVRSSDSPALRSRRAPMRPWAVTLPSSGRPTPPIILSRVDLPAPFFPTTPTVRPLGTVKLIPAAPRSAPPARNAIQRPQSPSAMWADRRLGG